MINTWEKPVLLAPSKTVPKESAEKKVNIEVSKFLQEQGGGSTPMPEYAATQGPKPTPGFELLTAIVVLIMVIALRRRL